MCKSIVETGKKIRNFEQNDKGITGKEKENAENLNKLKTQLTKYKDCFREIEESVEKVSSSDTFKGLS